jgi:hypothetical protein
MKIPVQLASKIRSSHKTWRLAAVFAALSALLPLTAQALEALDDEGMAGVNGQGIAILPENFQIAFNDLAYIQAIPKGLPTYASNNVADLYWYGLQLTGANNVTSRAGTPITSWGTASNPWLLKVESPTAYLYNGTLSAYPVLNYYAPAVLAADVSGGSVNNGGIKYSFWGDVITRDRTTSGCVSNPSSCAELARMESQSIWNDFTLNGSRFSIFQSTKDQSFGLSWVNRINSKTTGVMRFSVAESTQATGAPATTAPVFTNNEGLYITDMDINMIVGVQHYQPVILDNGGNTDNAATPWNETKNIVIEVVRIPQTAAVYNAFYKNYGAAANGNAAYTGTTCTNAVVDCGTATHSQISMGNVTFKDPAGATTANLGSTLIDGLMIQHLKITSTGL